MSHDKRVTKRALLKAIQGSGGIRREIARRLGVTRMSIYRCLKRPGWEFALEALEVESERVVDESEVTVRDMVKQREDLGVAFAASKFILQTKGAERGYRKEISISGGSTPIRMEAAIVNLDGLSLPVEMRRQMLEAMEKPPETIDVPHLQIPEKAGNTLDAEFTLVEDDELEVFEVKSVRKRVT